MARTVGKRHEPRALMHVQSGKPANSGVARVKYFCSSRASRNGNRNWMNTRVICGRGSYTDDELRLDRLRLENQNGNDQSVSADLAVNPLRTRNYTARTAGSAVTGKKLAPMAAAVPRHW